MVPLFYAAPRGQDIKTIFTEMFFSHPKYNKKKRKNVVLSMLLNFGGGVLIANCFCHWLPEVREGLSRLEIIYTS